MIRGVRGPGTSADAETTGENIGAMIEEIDTSNPVTIIGGGHHRLPQHSSEPFLHQHTRQSNDLLRGVVSTATSWGIYDLSAPYWHPGMEIGTFTGAEVVDEASLVEDSSDLPSRLMPWT